MKLAFLISAYTDAKQLGNMIEALESDEHWFFVHVDKKVDIGPFAEICKQYKHTKLTTNRFCVNWGGYNQVLYQKEMLRSCIDCNVPFDRVFILTAQDYPLWNQQRIIEILESNPNKEWLYASDITTMAGNIGKRQRRKVTLYHFFRDIPVRNYSVKKAFSGSARIIMRMLPFRKKPFLVVEGNRWDIHYGSSYMCVTMNLARYIYNQMSTNRGLMKYFKHSYVPEELVIPTIALNSPYASYCEKKDGGELIDVSAVTYFNYSDAIQVFDETNYEELIQSGKMFARKFSSEKSVKLMEMLKDNKKTILK